MSRQKAKTTKCNDEVTTMGRPKGSGKYTPGIGNKIIDLMADGASLRDIAAMAGMPSRQTMSAWGNNGEVSSPDFPGRYARARAAGCHSQFEDIREIEQKLLREEFEDPQNARIASDLIKWRLSKMLPGVYGERTHVEHSGEVKLSPKDHAPEGMVDRLTEMNVVIDPIEPGTRH